MNLAAFAPDEHPGMARQMAERNERFRAAAQHALDVSRGGKDLTPEARRWALHWAAIPALKREAVPA